MIIGNINTQNINTLIALTIFLRNVKKRDF